MLHEPERDVLLWESVAFEKSTEKISDLGWVPHMARRTGTFFDSKSGKSVTYHLFSEYEHSDDFKTAQKELEEIARRQAHSLGVRMDRAMRSAGRFRRRECCPSGSADNCGSCRHCARSLSHGDDADSVHPVEKGVMGTVLDARKRVTFARPSVK